MIHANSKQGNILHKKLMVLCKNIFPLEDLDNKIEIKKNIVLNKALLKANYYTDVLNINIQLFSKEKDNYMKIEFKSKGIFIVLKINDTFDKFELEEYDLQNVDRNLVDELVGNLVYCCDFNKFLSTFRQIDNFNDNFNMNREYVFNLSQ